MTVYKAVRISEDLFSEITEVIKKYKLWINEVDFTREAIREKISRVKAEA